MAASQWVINVDQSSFNQQVIEPSYRVPVLVDFWAPWCGPCRALGPILEKLANEMAGRFILAKVNSDENPQLSQQFGVQGIPACKLVIEGAIVDAFTGALPESGVRQFLDKAIPSAADNEAAQAALLAQRGDLLGALELYQKGLAEQPDHTGCLVGAASIALAQGKDAEASAFMERLTPKGLNSDAAKALQNKLAFRQTNQDVETLRQDVARHPDNLDHRITLGQALIAQEQIEAGLEQLLLAVKQDRHYKEDHARKLILKVFEMLGHAHPITSHYRGKLSQVLFT
ncbi:Thioredoxin domain [Magnetococcus marinus MC-1]|uniref:Thioredoxin domain n=1 Tax=Magnetococcus marinus (strain ATCC BAA-1437 / JCM 17883 / MC-1) TaxID=156889 RepID=A0LCM9_MAGMM|nr:tetratricopeptide repeat protein [Magnetococcus marinus]ABK45722.1 Thioredoxin domain [Magnetococcus marinus MC-1]